MATDTYQEGSTMSDEQVYNYQGHHVRIVGGQRKISDRGTLDRTVVDVKTVEGTPGIVGLTFSVPRDALKPLDAHVAAMAAERVKAGRGAAAGTYYAKCHACGKTWASELDTTASTFTSHEYREHDGAQTVWTRTDELEAVKPTRPRGRRQATSHPAMTTRDERRAHYIEHADELAAFKASFETDRHRPGVEHRQAGTIRDRNGAPCTRATFASYPLYSVCSCGAPIILADGSADWSARITDVEASCERAGLAFDDLEAARACAIDLASETGQWVAVHERGCEPNGNLHYIVKAHGFTALDPVEVLDERVVAFVVGDEVTR